MSDISFTAGATPSAANPAGRQDRRSRCAHCGRPFGLVRHRLASKQLCSASCLAAEGERMQRALKEKVRRFARLPGRG
jgi:hypothetical protein